MDFYSNLMVNLDLRSDNGITASLIPFLVHCILGGFVCKNVLNSILYISVHPLSLRLS